MKCPFCDKIYINSGVYYNNHVKVCKINSEKNDQISELIMKVESLEKSNNEIKELLNKILNQSASSTIVSPTCFNEYIKQLNITVDELEEIIERDFEIGLKTIIQRTLNITNSPIKLDKSNPKKKICLVYKVNSWDLLNNSDITKYINYIQKDLSKLLSDRLKNKYLKDMEKQDVYTRKILALNISQKKLQTIFLDSIN